MNSPARAIAWEIWRKNRYGFLLLMIFFLVCVGLSQTARHYSALVGQLASELPHASTIMSREGTRPPDTRRDAMRDTAEAIEPPVAEPRGDGQLSPVPSPDQRKPPPTSPSGGGMRYTLPPLPAPPPELGEAQLQANYWVEFATGWSGVLLGLSLLVTLALFAFAETTSLRGFSGIPSRLFTLPVRTRQLIAVPMALGICFVALLYLTWSRLVFASLPPVLPNDARLPDGYFLLLLPAALAWFQALVWILPGFPKTRATLLIVLITTVAVLSGLPFEELNRWPERKLALMAIYATALGIAPFVAWLGVRKVRQGEWRDSPALTALMNRLTDASSRRHGFASPASALFWIECRRNGRLALGGLVVVIVLFMVGASTIALWDGDKLPEAFGLVFWLVLLFLIFIWTPVVGLMVCGDVASRRLPLTMVQAVRPVTSGEFVSAKLKAMLAIWIGGWLLATIGIVAWAAVLGEFATLSGALYPARGPGFTLLLAIAAVFSVHVLFGLFPLWLSGRVPGLPWSFVVLLILYAGMGNVISWLSRHPDYSNAALLLIGFAAALKLGGAFLAFRQALKQKLVQRGFVFGSISIWIVGTAFYLRLMSWIVESGNWNGTPMLQTTLMLPFAALLFPIARVALAPLAMAMNRHR